MDFNLNQLPPGFELPATFEGCKVLDVEQASIEDGQTEQAWVVACRNPERRIVRKKIPKSALVKVEPKKEEEKTEDAPAGAKEGT